MKNNILYAITGITVVYELFYVNPVQAAKTWGTGSRSFQTSLNLRNLPKYQNIQASFYTYQSNSVGPNATSTTVRFNSKKPMIAVSFRALKDHGIYNIAYGDIVRIHNPANGVTRLVVVADVGGLGGKYNPNRHLDLTESLFKELAGVSNTRQGIINGLSFEVVNRIMEPPTRRDKFGGFKGNAPVAIQARIDGVEAGKYNRYLENRSNPIQLATKPLEKIDERVGSLVKEPLSEARELAIGFKTERQGWEQLLAVRTEMKAHHTTGFEELTVVQSRNVGSILQKLRQSSLYNQNIAAVVYEYQTSYIRNLQNQNTEIKNTNHTLGEFYRSDAGLPVKISTF